MIFVFAILGNNVLSVLVKDINFYRILFHMFDYGTYLFS